MAVSQAAALQLLQDFQQLQAHRAELYSSLSKGFRDFLGHGQEGHLARLMAADITPGFAAVSQQVIAIETCLRSSAVGRVDLAGLLRQVQELERDKLRLTLSWQALRAAHASGRFSWQSEADRPRLSTSINQQQNQQQQQKQDVTGMLEQVQLQRSSAAAARVSNDVAALGGPDQHGNIPQQEQQQQQVDGFMSVKPGFYEQQLQQAAAAAAGAEHAEQVQQQQQDGGEQHGHSHSHGCCSHGHAHDHDHGPPDPLDAGSLEPTEAEYNAAVREALQQLDECVVGINEVLQEVQEAVAELQQEADM